MESTDAVERSGWWRTGTWTSAVAAIEEAHADSSEALEELVVRSFDGVEPLQRASYRIKKLAGLLQLIDQNRAERARLEAQRADVRGAGVAYIASMLPRTFAEAATDIHRPWASGVVLERIRSVTIEDVECIFDFEVMGAAAKRLAIVLFDRVNVEQRYDDLKFAMLFANVMIEGGHRTNPSSFLELTEGTLRALLETPVVSDSDAATRVAPLRRFVKFFDALRAVPGDVEALVEAARAATTEGFEVASGERCHNSVVGRFTSAFYKTANARYLDELAIFCEAVPAGETALQQVHRLNALGAVLGTRGFASQGVTDLEAAALVQEAVSKMGQPDDPARVGYCANLALTLACLSSLKGAKLPAELGGLWELLPPVTFHHSATNSVEDGHAYAVKLRLELQLAFESRSHDVLGELGAELETARIAAVNAGQPAVGLSPLAVTAALARLLHAARNPGYELHDRDLLVLCEVLSAVHAFPGIGELAFQIAAELVRERAASRGLLREALEISAACSTAQFGEQLSRAFQVHMLLAELMSLDGDWEDGPDGWLRIVGVLDMLTNIAVTSALREPQRLWGMTALRQVSQLHRNVATRFARDGQVEIAAGICEGSAGLLAYRMEYRLAATRDKEEIAERIRDAGKCPAVIVIPAGGRLVVLARRREATWELVRECTSDALESFSSFSWLEAGHDQMAVLKTWLDDLGVALNDLLGDLLAELQSEANGPVMCLPLGVVASYPLSLIAAVRDDVAPAVVIAPGPLVDEVVQGLQGPTAKPANVSVIVGAPQLQDTGHIDVERDLEAIESVGIKPVLIDSASTEIAGQLGSSEIIHFVGHLFPAGPDDTRFVIADGTTLSLAAIRKWRLSRTLVATLISCYSGLWRSDAAEQVEHAAGAFLEAGARAVVGCLWPAFDHPAFLFTQAFYGDVRNGGSVAASFASGIDAIRGFTIGSLVPYEHPVYWAGFTLFASASTWWETQSEAVRGPRPPTVV